MDSLGATLFSEARLSSADHVSGVPARATRPDERDRRMTDEALERLSVLYALGDAIRAQDRDTALAMVDHLLKLVSSGAEWPHCDTAASPDAALMAERRPSTTRH
jgi:hypothetical protein